MDFAILKGKTAQLNFSHTFLIGSHLFQSVFTNNSLPMLEILQTRLEYVILKQLVDKLTVN